MNVKTIGSDGHGLSDEDCLRTAHQLNFVLEYVFLNWQTQMQSAAEYRRQAQEWSDPTSAPEKS